MTNFDVRDETLSYDPVAECDDIPLWPLTIQAKPDWMKSAACKGEPSSAFFPESGIVSKRAKAICNKCDVQAECLEYAVALPDLVGVWAGTSQRGRRALRLVKNGNLRLLGNSAKS